MEWDEFVAAAQAISWVAYMGTADASGNPHVAAVAPGFSPGTIWVATRPGSKKFRNLRANPRVGLHWPVAGEGPGELAAWGSVVLHESADSTARIWDAGYMSFDLAPFFGSKDNSDLAFIQAEIDRARLLGPDFTSRVWTTR
jgi:general stress protein 26